MTLDVSMLALELGPMRTFGCYPSPSFSSFDPTSNLFPARPYTDEQQLLRPRNRNKEHLTRTGQQQRDITLLYPTC
ncbi:hypothetical protein D9619_013710 [Psilocybe cf. subviscida]|uniref:Uncharacterized protein n=1 Tax=Psilocybe cf. subviscida TaxID=2480587 RepID=A0A8H5AZ86_9AGAR|nr:hypothetical protein D9619_013710 [Psilocybe cf. subviscida]